MALKFERIKAGDVLYDRRQGHEWTVYVKEVDAERSRALASWNGNAPRWYSARMITRYSRTSMYAKKKEPK